MLKLPFILSVYTLESNNTTALLDINIEFKVSNEYNKTINYKIHDIINNTDKNYIRNHIKQLNAVHSNDLVTINKLLTEENTKLKEKINAYETQINNYSIQLTEIEKLKSLLNQKYIDLEHKYEILSSNTENITTTYLDKLSIINSNINEIIIKEKNKLFDN